MEEICYKFFDSLGKPTPGEPSELSLISISSSEEKCWLLDLFLFSAILDLKNSFFEV
jgi:hypothetical protein